MSRERCAARERLISAHAPLCRRVARRFRRRGVDVRDLEQIAALGLVKAADRFDSSLGTPFEAYAHRAIVGELMHYVRDHERAIRLPRDLYEQQSARRRALERLALRLQREPTERELADELRCTLERVRDLERAAAAAEPLALDAAADRAASERPCERIEDRLVLGRALAALPPLERDVVLGVYALGLSQSELAARFSLHPRHVSRLHRRALDAMRERVA